MKNYSFRKAFLLALIIYAVGCLFFGCSPEKRLHRLLLKHPDLLKEKTTTVIDTIISQDTIFIPSKKDSFIIVTDTIIKTRNFEVQKIGPRFFVTSVPDTFIKHDTDYIIIKHTEKIETKKSDPLSRFGKKIVAFVCLVFLFSIIYSILKLFWH